MKEIEARQRRHILYTWTAQKNARPLHIAGGKGAWFHDEEENWWLDFESQIYNANAGHGEERIIAAIRQQAERLGVASPAAVFETKARLGEALAEITPGDLNHFFLCLSGADANENALKIARLVTGRQKVIARRRSYHGATMGALSLTGDSRRWSVEPGLWGVLRTEDPYCYRCVFGSYKGEACSLQCANHLEHVIKMEGRDRIAAVFLEGVTGANGGFIPPSGYWPRIREICDRYGILLVSDEVFSGFGRTGEWFAVDHWGVVPDIITMAKGLTGGYATLGVVAMSEAIAARFEDEKLWCGLTGYAHPIACATALAAIEVYHSDELIERAAQLNSVLQEGLEELMQKHRLIGDVRSIGLFGTIELVVDREPRAPLKEKANALSLRRGLRLLLRSGVYISPSGGPISLSPHLSVSLIEI